MDRPANIENVKIWKNLQIWKILQIWKTCKCWKNLQIRTDLQKASRGHPVLHTVLNSSPLRVSR